MVPLPESDYPSEALLLHHEARLSRRFREVVLERSGVPLQARDRPADVVVPNRVREAVAVRDDCDCTNYSASHRTHPRRK